MCDGVRPWLDREMKVFHRQLQATVGAGVQCTCVYTPRGRHNKWHDIIGCRWAAAIQNYHTGDPDKIPWYQSKSNLWDHPDHGPWEIAKLFMSDLGKNGRRIVIDAQSTDATGLISLITWCGYIGVPQNLAIDVMDTRNRRWAHNPNQKLNNEEKEKAFKGIKDLLKIPKLATDCDAEKNLAEIQAFEDADLNTIQQAEVHVLKEFILDVRRNDKTLKSINKKLEKLATTQGRSISESSESFQMLILIFIYQTFLIFCKSLLQKSRTLLLVIFLILSVQHLGNGTLSDSK